MFYNHEESKVKKNMVSSFIHSYKTWEEGRHMYTSESKHSQVYGKNAMTYT